MSMAVRMTPGTQQLTSADTLTSSMEPMAKSSCEYLAEEEDDAS